MPEHTSRRLAELLDPLITANGVSPSSLPGVNFLRAVEPTGRVTAVYTPRIAVLAQGRKHVWLGDEHYAYDANNFFVVSAPLPVDCQTDSASEEEPLLGFTITVDPVMVGELMLAMGDVSGAEPRSFMSSLAVTDDVIDASERLAKALASPLDAQVLGPQIVREIVYRVLLTEEGAVLRLLTSNASRFGQIARVLRRIHADYASELDVATLATEANLGLTRFHQAFREVTATSPLQYIKSIRLHRARVLLTTEGLTAQEASRAVGYASSSQFSREYRRMFGSTPASDRAAQPA